MDKVQHNYRHSDSQSSIGVDLMTLEFGGVTRNITNTKNHPFLTGGGDFYELGMNND